MDELSRKLNQYFAGRVVRKDLTKKIKEGANVPVYVLEYLLGMYCATDDEEGIAEGVETVKRILAENFVRPDEAEKVKSKIREIGKYTVIDKVSVKLNEKKDVYEAEFSNLGIKGVAISPTYVKQYEKLLCGGIWCIIKMDYYYDEEAKGVSPFNISNLTPIQMPNLDMEEILSGRKYFTKDEWIDILLRSIGMEPTRFENNVKWHLLARMIPLVENNYNLCELGPRGTGKSHVYKEISPNSILGVCPERRTHARGIVTSCIQDTSRAGSNAICSFQCLPQAIRPPSLRACACGIRALRLGKLDAAFEHHYGKEPATSCIMMQSMTIPLAVRPVNPVFSGSLLVSGGQTTVANLFYNMASRQIGLVGLWDCVAFDEVAGISFKDKDGIQIMKDYMASGSFARGKEEKNASASMVFVGNINQSVDVLLKTSHLFDPFPEAMANDTAFFDRMHYYIPGWEIPKMRPEFFTDEYGFITDYVSEFMREMRKRSFSDALDKFFKLGNNLNQRDVIAVRKTVSGLVKLIYPNGEFTRDDIEEILRYALVGRRRVKEQLKKIGGMEFYDVHFSYIDNETMNEEFVPVPEQGGGKIIPEGMGKPGHLYTIARGKSGMIGAYKIETQVISGTGKFERTGLGSDREAKESIETAFRYFRANSKKISGSISVTTKDYLMHVQDIHGVGMTSELALAAFVALCSGALGKPPQSQLVVLGSLSIGGTIIKVEELANVLQVCFDSGAKRVLLPMASAVDIPTVPPELFAKFQISFYQSPEDAVFKALGVE